MDVVERLGKAVIFDTIAAEPKLAHELLVELQERAKDNHIFLSRTEQNKLVTLALKVRTGIIGG